MTNSTDVLITVTTFGGGGSERYVEDLAVGLKQRNIGVAVSVDSGPLNRVRRLVSEGVLIRVLAPELIGASSFTKAFRELVDQLRPRLIHVSGWTHHREIIDVAAACHIPTIYTNHCTPRQPLLRERLGVNRVPFAFYRQRALARRSGPAISISQLGLKNLGLRLANRVPSVVVYNGVPQTNDPATIPCVTAAPRIIWLGSLIRRKRPLLAIGVFERLLDRHPKAQLIILGDGPLLPDVLRAAARLPPEAVQIRGFCMSVTDALRGGYVYLQTSADEGLAYSVLDAMSVGLPVIATDAGATREAVLHEKTGLVSPVDDAEVLHESLLRLLNSPEKAAKYGQEGLKRARDVFGLDRMVRETLSAYKHLCGVDISCPPQLCRDHAVS